MCGIAGIVSVNSYEISEERLKLMTDIIAHRGPDGDGQWINENGKVGLGHRRLSIIDLSEAGKQPMQYLDRYTITFNGEIYNYIELKEMCTKQGYLFVTHTDTEVLMALYDWKKEKCLQYFDGMFSFALYDAKEKKIFAARDRFGEKPFYYHSVPGKLFAFASEMKALWAGGIKRSINNKMLYNYLEFGYISNPNNVSETFFEEIYLLPQAHYTFLNIDSLEFSVHRYWDIDHKIQDYSITEDRAMEKFKELFYMSVSRRLRSDVPVGSSLSGGLDSSAIVSVINELNAKKGIKQTTFSAVFPGFEYDESTFIMSVINNLNVIPFFTTPDSEVMLNELRNVFFYHEEPFTSASMLAQYEVLKLAKSNNITVLLDGQGADEILAGYHPFYLDYFDDLKKSNRKLYAKEKQAYLALHGNSKANPVYKKSIKDYARKINGPVKQQLKKGYKWIKNTTNPKFNSDFYHAFNGSEIILKDTAKTLNHALYNSVQWGLTHLLRYGDRSGMAHSREVRMPFLNHELVEFIFTLPPQFKIHNGWTKYIQRKTFENLLPKEITWRKDKIGYEPPQKMWMEQKIVQNEIMSSRNLLVEQGILHKKILKEPIRPARPSEATDGSWRHWMCGFLIKP